MQELSYSIEPVVRLFSQPRMTVLMVVLVTAAVIDLRTFRIPNWLTVGAMVLGLLINTVQPQQVGFLWALAGLAVGLLMLVPLYALGVMGAGDVKLMAAVGAFLGLPAIVFAVLSTLIVGGVAAVVFSLYRRAFRRMTGNVVDIVQSMAFAAFAGIRPQGGMAGGQSVGRLPYGLSIAVGTLGWLATSQLSFA